MFEWLRKGKPIKVLKKMSKQKWRLNGSPKGSSRTSVIFREAANDAWICLQFAESWKTSQAKQVDFAQLSLRAPRAAVITFPIGAISRTKELDDP